MLREVQYRGSANLDARAAIYQYAPPRPSIQEFAAALVPGGAAGKAVLDVGCGPGSYATAFAAARNYVGVDLSAGMLDEARARNGLLNAAVADAQRLPVRDASFDVVLAMHMLYHVPDRRLAIDELARVVRDDGAVLVVTNAAAHHQETVAVVAAAYQAVTGRVFTNSTSDTNFKLERAPGELERRFVVSSHPYAGTLTVPDATPVVAYIASLRGFVGLDDDADWARCVDRARALVDETIDAEGAFRITGSSGVLVCHPR